MRYLPYIIVLVLFSCSKGERYKKSAKSVEAVADEVNVNMIDNSYESILSEKLHTYVDLLHLKNQHPDFQEDILIQLGQLSQGEIIPVVNTISDKINNVKIEYPPKRISDSVQEFKLKYQLFKNSKQLEDSLFARIVTKEISLGDDIVKTNKIEFFSTNPNK